MFAECSDTFLWWSASSCVAVAGVDVDAHFSTTSKQANSTDLHVQPSIHRNTNDWVVVSLCCWPRLLFFLPCLLPSFVLSSFVSFFLPFFVVAAVCLVSPSLFGWWHYSCVHPPHTTFVSVKRANERPSLFASSAVGTSSLFLFFSVVCARRLVVPTPPPPPPPPWSTE